MTVLFYFQCSRNTQAGLRVITMESMVSSLCVRVISHPSASPAKDPCSSWMLSLPGHVFNLHRFSKSVFWTQGWCAHEIWPTSTFRHSHTSMPGEQCSFSFFLPFSSSSVVFSMMCFEYFWKDCRQFVFVSGLILMRTLWFQTQQWQELGNWNASRRYWYIPLPSLIKNCLVQQTWSTHEKHTQLSSSPLDTPISFDDIWKWYFFFSLGITCYEEGLMCRKEAPFC